VFLTVKKNKKTQTLPKGYEKLKMRKLWHNTMSTEKVCVI